MRTLRMVLACLAVVLFSGPAGAAADEIGSAQLKAFAPLPEEFQSKSNPMTPAKIKLGRMLYYDSRLSRPVRKRILRPFRASIERPLGKGSRR